MKTWITRIILVAIAVAAGIWAWSYFHPSPEKVIRKRMTDLARTVSVDANEGQISRMARAQNLPGYFTSDVEVTVDVSGYRVETIEGREELLQAAMAARTRASSLKVDIVDLSVALAADSESAEAHFTGKAQLAGERTLQAQEMRAFLIHTNGDWLIRKIETVRTLR